METERRMNFHEEFLGRIEYVKRVMADYLPDEEGYQKNVIEAMNYSVHVGGKRLRPILMLECYRLFGGTGAVVEPFMAALEMIHTYSLVHDDLPAMDNDCLRRGKPTTHVAYGEAIAILAGDGLLNYAFETALKAAALTNDTNGVICAMQILAKKAGIYGMIGGQTADVLAENKSQETTIDLLLFIHEHKTAALIEASLCIGAVLAGASEEDVKKLEIIGHHVGVAFQIQDDILDVIGDEQVLGKPIGSDEQNHKVTYVTMRGVEEAKEEVAKLSQEAITLLSQFERRNEFLEALIIDLMNREN